MEKHKPRISGLVLMVIYMYTILVSGQLCKNCQNGCDQETGECSGGCKRGWDGPTCSKQNVALRRNTTQSSTWSGYPSDLAVDGGKEQVFGARPICTHTQQNNQPAFWTVRLDKQYNIYSFRIYNRKGNCGGGPCGNRLNGFTLSVGNSSQGYRVCYQDTTTAHYGPGDIIDGVCNTSRPILGDTVKIMINNARPLTLCEVQIFVCTPGTYGSECGKRCGKCADGPSGCDTTSGLCPQRTLRCMPGYRSEKCDEECSNGTWGADCQMPCGQCYNNPQCNTTTGECLVEPGNPRCDPGYSGNDCIKECSNGTWGADCQMSCGHCYNNTQCNTATGDCPVEGRKNRCDLGYSRKHCTAPCSNNTWGDDCSQSCGQCYNSARCDVRTGKCPVEAGNPRCDPGYSGSGCVTKCSNGTWGTDCQMSCGQCYNNPQCNTATGECPEEAGKNRCDQGFSGTDCRTQVKPSAGGGGNAGLIGGAVAAAVALIVTVTLVVVIIIRRRRKANSKYEGQEEIEVDGHPQDPQANIAFQEDIDDPEVEPQVDVNPYVNADVVPTQVSVSEFSDYVARKKAAKGFEKEFQKFPVGLQAKHEAANKRENKAKSRYRSLVAYDHSRVLLSVTDGKGTDYINACYIDGYNEPKKYIASQGPNEVILHDFLRMIWEQKSGKIVMVTNLQEMTKTKCCQYWPDEGSENFGLITVTLLNEEFYGEFTVRTLLLTNNQTKTESYTVKQFHFTAWPDHGAPAHATGLLDFRDKVNGYQTQLCGPIVVHCSAGVGRTGTYIALDYLIAEAHDEGVVDVPTCVRQLRQQRVNMVQALEQYIFLHEALAESFALRTSSVGGAEFPRVYAELCAPDPGTGISKMAEQFQSLQRLTSPHADGVLTTARHPDNVTKNRSSRILAADICRPFLSTPVPDGNNYINAVFLPTLRSKKCFIVTQTPLLNTVLDFWRLVYDHGISVIVMIDVVKPRDTDVGVYWPKEGAKFDPFVVKIQDKEEREGFSVWTYHLTHKETKAGHAIKQFRCKFWPGINVPSLSSIPSLISIIAEANKWQEKTGSEPVLVHCRDGVTKSGVYCAAASVIERLKVDQEVNIVHSVKQMRANRPEVITDLDQFHFVHQVAKVYLEMAHIYENLE